MLMQEKTVIALGRMVCGTVILIASLATHTNGLLQGLSLFLIGVPVEMLRREKVEV
jgi:hypothetical protein